MKPLSPASLESDPLDPVAEAFLERLRRGERPALTEYTRQHPDLAERIEKLFPALMVLEELGSVEGQAGGSEVARAALKGQIPARLGEYRILREVGRGGMGIVYEAVQESLGRHVALKVLPFHSLLGPTRVERFRREAKAAARLHHTNIVPVFGVGEQDGIHYYAMQFISGQGVDDVLQEVRRLRDPEAANSNRAISLAASVAEGLMSGQFPESSTTTDKKAEDGNQKSEGRSQKSQDRNLTSGPRPLTSDFRSPVSEPFPLSFSSLSSQPEARYFRSVAETGIQVADALAYAHHEGVLHRDVKPSNLLLDTGGRVWVTDFGLAKAEDSDDLTQTGDMVGTLCYMASERLQGQADPRSDVYGLGITLYEMLTLRPAFTENNRSRLIERIAHDEPTAPRKLDGRIPRDLETIVLKAMAKEPALRYSSAEALAQDLRRVLADRPIHARRVSSLERTWRWVRRNPAVALSAGLAAAALVAAAVLGFSLAFQQHYAAELLGEEQRQTIGALAQVRQEKQQTQAALDEAENQKRTAERLSATYALEQGISLCERGDVALGMLWLTHSLRIVPDHAPELQRPIRANLAGWKRELRPVKGLLKHEDAVWAIAYSPDGELVLTGGWDKQGRLWNVHTGAQIGAVLPHDGYIFSVRFSPNGHQAVISGDSGVRIWDLTTEPPVCKALQGLDHSGPVSFSPDGRSLFTADPKGKIQRWDPASGVCLGDLCNHGARVYGLDVSPPNGRTIVTAGEDNCARLWDAVTGEAQGEPLNHQGFVHAVAFSHNGLRILTGSDDGFGRLWDATTLEQVGLPLPHRDKIMSVAFSQDDRLLLTGSFDGTVQMWDAETCQRHGPPLKHRSQVLAVACSPKGTRIATGGTENVVHLWDLQEECWTRPEATLDHHENKVRGLTVSPNRRDLLTACENGSAWVWDLKTRSVKGKPLRHRALVRAVAVSPDATVFLTGSEDCTAQLWDSATLKQVGQPIRHPNSIWAVAFSPDGQTILTGDVRGFVWRTKRTSPETPKVLFQHPPWVNGLAWSPDGKTVATAGKDRSARLWDALTGKPLGFLPHEDTVWAVAFSPDSRTIVTGSWDGTARLWDVATLKPRGAPFQHGGKVEAVAISPDGHTIVTAGLDGRARLWDATTGIPVGPPLIHRNMVVGVAFHPDGQTVVTGGLDSAVHIWPVPAPTQGSVADLVLQTQLLTGLQLEPGGAAVLLDAKIWSHYRRISVYSFMIALAPFHPEPVYQRGRLYDELGHLTKAIDDYTSALRLCSGNEKMECPLRAFRGRDFFRLGKPEQAAVDFQRALHLEFDQPMVLNTLAWIYVMGPAQLRDAERALPLTRRAVALNPKNPNHINTLGVVYYRLGRYSDAVSELEKSLGGNTVLAFDLLSLSMSYAHLGDLTKARLSYDRAAIWLENQKDPLSPWDAADIKALRAEADQVLADTAKPESASAATKSQ